MRKLKSDGLVTAYLSEESGGPARKYYSLTKTGKKEYYAARTEWLEFAYAVESLIKEDDDEKK